MEDNTQSGFPKLSVDVTQEQLEPMMQETSAVRNQRFQWGLSWLKGHVSDQMYSVWGLNLPINGRIEEEK